MTMRTGFTRAWNTFWFSDVSLDALRLFRIALGLSWAAKILFLLPAAPDFLTSDGAFTLEMSRRMCPHRLCVFDWLPLDSEPWILAASLGPALMLVFGIRPRASLVLLFALGVSLETRNPLIFNSGDRLLSMYALLGIFLPWSQPPKKFQIQTGWAARLIQIQLCALYLWTAYYKFLEKAWRDGSAVYWVTQNAQRTWGDWFGKAVTASGASPILTWGVLIFEALFPFLIWARPFRRPLLLLGAGLHLGLQAVLVVPVFQPAILTGYLLFLSDQEAHWITVNVAKLFVFRHNRG